MADFRTQFNDQFRLTTAEILYHLPDCPKLIQSYIWQDYDLAPQYPKLIKFLDFWAHNLDGKLHSILVANHRIITPSEAKFYAGEFTLQ